MNKVLAGLLGLPEATVAAVLGKLGDPAEDDTQKVLLRIQQKLEESAAADGSDVHKVKAQLQYDNTRLENEVHRLNKSVGQLKSTLDSASGEAKSARDELASAKSGLEEAQAELLTQQKRASALEAQASQLRDQGEQQREEKRELLRQIAERREQLDDRATEVSRLNEAVQELQQQRAADQVELARLRSQTSVSDVSEHMLKQSLELARSQIKWLDDELAKSQAEMQQTRAELGRAATSAKAEATRLRGEVESLREQIDELGGRNAQLERRLREKLEAERQAKEAAAEEAEQFRREMAAQKKLCAEWEKTTEAAKQHVRAVEASLQGLEAQQREGEARAQEAVDAAEQHAGEAEQACAAAQAQISRLEAELRAANKLVSEHSQSQLLSPTASAASRMRGTQGTLSITQLYADKLALEDRLRDADTEIGSLRQSMEQILAEIEERGPIIAAEREEHHRLLADADRIAQDLASVRQECAAKARVLEGVRKDADLAQRQLSAEQQQTRDLERQVARLLRAAEEARPGSRPMADGPRSARAPNGADQDGSEEQWLSDVDRVITQKLVTFSDIAELVAQNRRLLRTTRELAAQAAQSERKGDNSVSGCEDDGDSDDDALEQAEAMLSRLSAELERTKTRLGVAERERDMLKSLASRAGVHMPMSPPPAQDYNAGDAMAVDAMAVDSDKAVDEDLAQLQADFATYQSEACTTRAQLERDVTRLQEETSELRVRAAKAEAQTQFDADRVQLFTRDLEARQKEVDHLRLATARLHKQAESYERQLESATQEAAAGRAELTRLRRQAALLEAERDAGRQHEQRWRNEEQRLVAERASLTQILENTTHMRDEWRQASDSQVAQARERLEAARKETDTVREDLKRVRAEGESARFRFDTELRELRGQVQQRDEKAAQLQENAARGAEALARAQGEAREVEAARSALQRHVASLEERLRSQEDLVQRAQAQGQPATRESLLEVQLQDARSQLEALQSEVATTSGRAEDFRQLSESNEAALRELSETYDRYHDEQERARTALEARAAELASSLDEARTALAQCQEERDAAAQTVQATKADLESAASAHAARVAQLEATAEQTTLALDALRSDMQRHESAAQGLQEQYEREIVAHAKDIEATLLAREKLRKVQTQLAETRAELAATQEEARELQGGAGAARERAAQDVKAAETQLSEVRRQNALLLAHLESLGQRVPDVAAGTLADAVPEGAEGGRQAADAGDDGLRGVVMYLRRERDLAAAQLEVAQQEAQRWQQQAAQAQRMLDETRSELEQYAPGGDASSVEAMPAGDGPIMLTAAQRQACRQQMEQATLLRESNSVLRGELGTARGRLREVETALTRIRDQEVPKLRSTNASLQAELDAVRDRAQQLQEMCDHWKQRHESVLARHQLIEPEELEALKQENTRLAAGVEALRLENVRLQEQAAAAAAQKSAAASRWTKQLEAEISRLTAQVAALLAKLRDAQTQAEQQQTALEAAQAETQALTRDAHDQKAKFDKLHTTFQMLRKQSVVKLEQSSALVSAHEATIASLRSQVDAANTAQPAAEAPAALDAGAEPAADQAALQAEIAALTQAKDDAIARQQHLAAELQQATDDLEAARAEIAARVQSSGEAPAAAAGDDGASADNDKLRADLAAAEARVADYEAQLEQIKAKALKYARDNRVLQARATELEKKVQELSSGNLQTQLEELKKQLADADAKIEAAQINSTKKAELRTRLQVSRANKRADDLEKQVTELQAKVAASAISDDATAAAPLKRSNDTADAPAKKAHIDE